MGLDMSLFRRFYIGSEYEWNNVTGNVEISTHGKKLDLGINDVQCIDCNDSVYWRKANMIHKWFVDHCQDGNDDCKPYYVGTEQLHELLDTCLKVRDNPELARELLPTQEGFFFGCTDYDECYFDDINHTIKELSKLNLMGEDYSFDYYYRSSW